MKASDLKFDNPYNAAVSLGVIAEMVRRMDWGISNVHFRLRGKADQIVIVIEVPPPAPKRTAPA